MRTLVFTIALIAPSVGFCQQNQPPARTNTRYNTVAGGLEIGIPIGEFNDTWGRQMAGASANMTIPMRRLPLSWGFDFGYARMGGTKREIPVVNANSTAKTGELKVNSNIYGYHGMVRLQPFQGKFSPYVDGMAGFRHFVTKSSIDVQGVDQALEEQRYESKIIGSTGLAVGSYYAPAKNLVLELRLERLIGGQVRYVDSRSITIAQDGAVNYETLTSGTRILNLTFGVGIRF